MAAITGGNFAGSGRIEWCFFEKLAEWIHEIITERLNVAITERSVQSVGLRLTDAHLQSSTVDALGQNLRFNRAHQCARETAPAMGLLHIQTLDFRIPRLAIETRRNTTNTLTGLAAGRQPIRCCRLICGLRA